MDEIPPKVRQRRVIHGPPKVVELDDRGRCSLKRLAHPDHRLFFIHVDDAGVITLTPAVTVPLITIEEADRVEAEREKLRAWRATQDSEGVDRGSFAQYADTGQEDQT